MGSKEEPNYIGHLPHVSGEDRESTVGVYMHQKDMGDLTLKKFRGILYGDNPLLLRTVKDILQIEGYKPKQIDMGLAGAVAGAYVLARAAGTIESKEGGVISSEVLDKSRDYRHNLKRLVSDIEPLLNVPPESEGLHLAYSAVLRKDLDTLFSEGIVLACQIEEKDEEIQAKDEEIEDLRSRISDLEDRLERAELGILPNSSEDDENTSDNGGSMDYIVPKGEYLEFSNPEDVDGDNY